MDEKGMFPNDLTKFKIFSEMAKRHTGAGSMSPPHDENPIKA